MKQFFDETQAREREKEEEREEEGGKEAGRLGEAEKRVGGISGGAAISTYFHGSDFSGG